MIQSFDERLIKLREEINASPDYDTKFDIWVNAAAGICHDIATSKDESIQVDRFFYAFQSPPVVNPRFLIMAFNPADKLETTYIEGCKNKNRNYERITGKELKEPNMSWNKHNTWHIWQNLKKSFVSNELYSLLDSFVYMNMVYFGSAKVKSFDKNSGAKFAKQVCTELTNILVFDIFKTEVILCLGVESFAGIGNGFEQTQVKISSINEDVRCKQIAKAIIIGIPHTSGARNRSNEDRIYLGEAIHDFIFKTPITSANRVYSTKDTLDKSILNDLMRLVRSSDILSKLIITEGKEKGGNIRYIVEGFENDKLEITISSQGFIGVRYAKVGGLYNGSSEINYIRYLKFLDSIGFRNDDNGGNWIGKKSIGHYNTKEIDDLTNYIESDITRFLEWILK